MWEAKETKSDCANTFERLKGQTNKKRGQTKKKNGGGTGQEQKGGKANGLESDQHPTGKGDRATKSPDCVDMKSQHLEQKKLNQR